jgi:opacity protein-like surface antigen
MRMAVGVAIVAAVLWASGPSEIHAQETSNQGAQAQRQKPPPPPSPWSFSVSPYFWGAGLNGKVGVNSNLPTVDVGVKFTDIFKSIDWLPPPVMVAGEIRYDDFAAFTDFIFLGLEDEKGTARGPISVKADVKLDQIVWTFGGSYRFIDNEFGSASLLAGGRLWNLDAKGTLAGPLAVRQRSGSKTWVDPIIGLNVRFVLGGGFALQAEGDVGAGASKVDWQLLGTLQYQAEDWLSLDAGYRYLAVDFSDGGFRYNVALHGPVIGATLRF